MLLPTTYASDYDGNDVYVPNYSQMSKNDRVQMSRHLRGNIRTIKIPGYILVPGIATYLTGAYIESLTVFIVGFLLTFALGIAYFGIEEITLEPKVPKNIESVVIKYDRRWRALKAAFDDDKAMWTRLKDELCKPWELGNKLNVVVSQYCVDTAGLVVLLDELEDKKSEKARVLKKQLSDAAAGVRQQIADIFEYEDWAIQAKKAAEEAEKEVLAIEQARQDDWRIDMVLADTQHLVRPREVKAELKPRKVKLRKA